jgi:PAS domain S-box-containing protein
MIIKITSHPSQVRIEFCFKKNFRYVNLIFVDLLKIFVKFYNSSFTNLLMGVNQEYDSSKISHGGKNLEKKKPAEELKSIIIDSPDSIFVHNLDGNLIYANKTAHGTHLYGNNEFNTPHFNELDQIIHNNLLKHYNDLINNGSACFESSQTCYDGSIIDVDIDSNIMESEDDSLILSIVRNAGETKSHDHKQNKLYDMIKNTKKGMIIENFGIITYLNHNLCNQLGYNKEEILGHEYINFFNGIQEFSILDEIIKVKNGGISNLISKMLRKDGSNLWMLTTISPIYNKNGEYMGNLSTLRDITQLFNQ